MLFYFEKELNLGNLKNVKIIFTIEFPSQYKSHIGD